jgi:hypothetical protein
MGSMAAQMVKEASRTPSGLPPHLENAPNHPPDHLQLSVSVASSFTPGIFIEDDSHTMSMSEARAVIEDRD